MVFQAGLDAVANQLRFFPRNIVKCRGKIGTAWIALPLRGKEGDGIPACDVRRGESFRCVSRKLGSQWLDQVSAWTQIEVAGLRGTGVHLEQVGGPGRGFEDEVETEEAGKLEPRGDPFCGSEHFGIVDDADYGSRPVLVVTLNDLGADAGEKTALPAGDGTIGF